MASPAHLAGPAPVVWLLTDNKPGHRNQLKGLGNRLRVLVGADLHWVDVSTTPVPLWRALTGRPPALDPHLPAPQLILAAGTRTHRLLLALRRLKRCRTVVLMRPSFPASMVDAAIIPEHDGVKPGTRTLLTKGALNAITPMARLTEKPEALVLIGGPSRHFEWDDTLVFDQILKLMANHPSWRWTLSGSRRTPSTLLSRLKTLEGPKVTVADHQHTHENWLPHQLAASRAVWVTPDSSSMVFEAITSGVPTGVLELAPSPHSRIARNLPTLVAQGLVGTWSDQNSVMNHNLATNRKNHALWEADRAAHWLIEKFLGNKRS